MHAKRSRMVSDALGAKESLCALDNALNIVRKAAERNRNRLTGERPLVEDYCSGKAEIAFLWAAHAPSDSGKVGGPHGYYAYVAKASVDEVKAWSKGIEVWKKQIRDFKKICCGENESVLVDDIEGIKFIKFEVPSRIRLKRFEQIDDAFTGEMYASAFYGGFKPFRVGVPKYREAHGLLTEGFPGFRHDMVTKQVEGGSQIVDAVSGNESEIAWNGSLVFGPYASVQSLRILIHDGPIMGFEELSRQSVKLVDVVFGPF